MDICSCTDLEVDLKCIIRSIEEWTPSFYLVCNSCFEGEMTDIHDCFTPASVQQDVWEILSYGPICNEIYEIFVAGHTDCVQTLRNFKKVQTNYTK